MLAQSTSTRSDGGAHLGAHTKSARGKLHGVFFTRFGEEGARERDDSDEAQGSERVAQVACTEVGNSWAELLD